MDLFFKYKNNHFLFLHHIFSILLFNSKKIFINLFYSIFLHDNHANVKNLLSINFKEEIYFLNQVK
jgi:hypothetical protein